MLADGREIALISNRCSNIEVKSTHRLDQILVSSDFFLLFSWWFSARQLDARLLLRDEYRPLSRGYFSEIHTRYYVQYVYDATKLLSLSIHHSLTYHGASSPIPFFLFPQKPLPNDDELFLFSFFPPTFSFLFGFNEQ